MLIGKKWVNRKWKNIWYYIEIFTYSFLLLSWNFTSQIFEILWLSTCQACQFIKSRLLRQFVLSLLVVKNLYSEITNLNNAGRSNCIFQGEKDEFPSEREGKTLLFMAYNSASFNYFFWFLKYSSIKAHDSSIWQMISAIFWFKLL